MADMAEDPQYCALVPRCFVVTRGERPVTQRDAELLTHAIDRWAREQGLEFTGAIVLAVRRRSELRASLDRGMSDHV